MCIRSTEYVRARNTRTLTLAVKDKRLIEFFRPRWKRIEGDNDEGDDAVLKESRWCQRSDLGEEGMRRSVYTEEIIKEARTNRYD